jgi:DNA-damage-inducible protein J
MEPEVKKQAEELFRSLGISLSDAFNMFACQAIRERGIPFTVSAEPNYKPDGYYRNPPYAARLRAALAEIERGECETFVSARELTRDALAGSDDDV